MFTLLLNQKSELKLDGISRSRRSAVATLATVTLVAGRRLPLLVLLRLILLAATLVTVAIAFALIVRTALPALRGVAAIVAPVVVADL
jgi:hypothetical protein